MKDLEFDEGENSHMKSFNISVIHKDDQRFTFEGGEDIIPIDKQTDENSFYQDIRETLNSDQ